MQNVGGDLRRRGWSWTTIAPDQDPTDILSSLGPLVPRSRAAPLHDELRPYRRESAPPSSMSALVGTAAQPMHTDAAYWPEPPRYVALYCIDPGEAPCATHVWSLDFDRLREELPRILTEPIWVTRGGGSGAFYCTVLDVRDERLRIRFDLCCMRLAFTTLPDLQVKIASEVNEALRSYAQKVEVFWQHEAMLILDNWRCLHARGPGAHLAPSRWLRRWNIGGRNGLGC
jgi:hypothetical protein